MLEVSARARAVRRGFEYARERSEYERRVEVVRPCLIRVGAVGPRAVLAPASRDVEGGARPPFDPIVPPDQRADRGERFAREQGCVEDARAVERRVAEADLFRRLVATVQIP